LLKKHAIELAGRGVDWNRNEKRDEEEDRDSAVMTTLGHDLSAGLAAKLSPSSPPRVTAEYERLIYKTGIFGEAPIALFQNTHGDKDDGIRRDWSM